MDANGKYTRNCILVAAFAGTVIMTACVSTPVPNAALEHARTVVNAAEADPNVARYSALDLETAKRQLAIAESAAMHHDDAAVTQPAYMAGQTARLAQLTASAKSDDARVAAGQAERDQIQLAARTRELNEANAEREQAAAKAAALQAEAAALKAKRSQ